MSNASAVQQQVESDDGQIDSLPEPTPRIKRVQPDMTLLMKICRNDNSRRYWDVLQRVAQAYIEVTIDLSKLSPKLVRRINGIRNGREDATASRNANAATAAASTGEVRIDANVIDGNDRRLVLKRCVHATLLPKGTEIKSITFPYSVEFTDICHRKKQFEVIRFEMLDGTVHEFYDFYSKHVLVSDEARVKLFVDEQIRLGLEDGRIDDLIQRRHSWQYTQTFPAGEYYIGDPCYLFGGESYDKWMALLEATDYSTARSQHIDNVPIFFHRTAHGDGRYHDNDGNTYYVDAGLIGILPTSIIVAENGMQLPELQYNDNGCNGCSRIVAFTHPFKARARAGVFSFGDEICINTSR